MLNVEHLHNCIAAQGSGNVRKSGRSTITIAKALTRAVESGRAVFVYGSTYAEVCRLRNMFLIMAMDMGYTAYGGCNRNKSVVWVCPDDGLEPRRFEFKYFTGSSGTKCSQASELFIDHTVDLGIEALIRQQFNMPDYLD